MQHTVGSLHGATHLLEATQVPLDNLDTVCERGNMLLFTRGEIVEDTDLLTALKQRLHQMGADETGCTRHQDALRNAQRPRSLRAPVAAS